MSEIDDEDIQSRIIDEGEQVFCHDWDSGSPGAGAGTETIYRWNGAFYFFSLDSDSAGPFATFDEALQDPCLGVTSATESVWCSLLPTEELAKRLVCFEPEGCCIKINDELWECPGPNGSFQRVSKPNGTK